MPRPITRRRRRTPGYYAGGAVVTIVTDTFTRASDNVTLGTADTGQAWANFGPSSRWTITSGQANPFQAGGFTSGTIIDAASAVGTVQFTENFATGIPGVVFRWVDATNYMLWSYSSATNMNLSKFVAGVETVLANDVVTAPASALLYSVSVTAGNVITCKRGGVTIRTFTDGTNASGTKWGIGGAVGTSDLFDNFTVTSP